MKVLVAVDESEGSFHALSWALDKLFRFVVGTDGTDTSPETSIGTVGAEMEIKINKTNYFCNRLILMHAQQPLQHFMQPVGPSDYPRSFVMETVKKAQQENSMNVLNKAMQICKEKMVNAETIIVDGEPKEMICQCVEQMQIDLLVMGSRGLGRIKRTILGSVSDYCAQHAKCAVLIVKPQREKH